MKNKQIIENYSGKNVARYEQNRKGNPKWDFETNTIVQVLESIKNEISSLIDAPVGTGRFFPQYNKYLKKVKIYCCDLSDDMLKESSKRIRFFKKKNYTFFKHDLISSELALKSDLTVCFRFLNLFDWKQAKQALTHILMAANRYSVFTIRTIDESYEGPDMIEDKIYLHDRNDVCEVLKINGFSIKKEYLFNDTKGGHYSTIFCQRTNSNS